MLTDVRIHPCYRPEKFVFQISVIYHDAICMTLSRRASTNTRSGVNESKKIVKFAHVCTITCTKTPKNLYNMIIIVKCTQGLCCNTYSDIFSFQNPNTDN